MMRPHSDGREGDTVELELLKAEPSYVRWATELSQRPAYAALVPPTEEEAGSIYEAVYREVVLKERPRARTSQNHRRLKQQA
jgi:hypothetical protein